MCVWHTCGLACAVCLVLGHVFSDPSGFSLILVLSDPPFHGVVVKYLVWMEGYSCSCQKLFACVQDDMQAKIIVQTVTH